MITQQQTNWWRYQGIDCLGPRATEVMFHVLNGADSVMKVSRITGLSVGSTTSHLRRLRGLGLIRWTRQRGDRITPLVVIVNIEPNGPCGVESTRVD